MPFFKKLFSLREYRNNTAFFYIEKTGFLGKFIVLYLILKERKESTFTKIK